MNYNIENYLDEKQLGSLLKDLYPNVEFVHDRQVPNSGIKSRPDYRSDELMLIVEFDGAQHYQTVSNILKDRKKDGVYSDMGYKVVRIPYFVQPVPLTIKHYFGIDSNITSNFKHGFISDDIVLPCDFCTMGINRFSEDMKEMQSLGLDHDIMASLYMKIEDGLLCTVVPPIYFDYFVAVDKELCTCM